MTWGTVTVGGIAFREELTVQETGDGKVTVKGQESTPPQELPAVLAGHRNVLALAGAEAVPVTFTDKAGLTGFYRVEDAASELFHFASGSIVRATWELHLVRLGTERDVEWESRVPTIGRLSDFPAVTPVFWHAPPAGHRDYFTGPQVPAASTVRSSSDGDVTVYRGLPASSVPRWTVPAASYLNGSARVLLDGIRRAGLDTPAHTSWEVSNGIVRVRGVASGRVEVSCWSGGRWRSPNTWVFWTSGSGGYLSSTPELTILRNDPEEVVVRLAYPVSPGRLTVDLSVRRGSRVVTGVIKRNSASQFSVERIGSATHEAVTGGLVQTDADADGNRFVMASTRNVGVGVSGELPPTGTTFLYDSVGSHTSMDFLIGHQVGGVPQAGDAFADLFAQYLGTTGETVRGVRR